MAIALNITGLRISDAIIASLSTSLAAYQAAAAGGLVPITNAEYDTLFATLSDDTKTGSTDTHLAGAINIFAGNITYRDKTYTSGQNLIAGYMVAFKIKTQANTSITSGVQFGYGTTATGTGVAGCTKTTATFTPSGNLACFVVKSPSVMAPAGAFMTTWVSSNNLISAGGGTQNYQLSASDVLTTTPSSQGAALQVQCLQTPTLQWG